MQKCNAASECVTRKRISFPISRTKRVFSGTWVDTGRAMELFRAEVVAVLESDTKKDCPSCGERLKLVRTIVTSRTGSIVHMFECPCGQRTWAD